jgi:hypothetical protein
LAGDILDRTRLVQRTERSPIMMERV